MEREISPSDAQATGFQSGYDTNYNYSDNDVVRSDGENLFTTSDW